MTYPQIGNYGVNAEDVESGRPQLAGFVVREHSRTQSNFRSEQSLSEYLQQWGIVAIESIDTRALVRRLRSGGAMKGVLSTVDLDDASLVAKARVEPRPRRPRPGARSAARSAIRMAPAAQRMDALAWQGPRSRSRDAISSLLDSSRLAAPHVVALDYGMKWNIPRHLIDQGCRVTILPGTATADDVLAQQPDGVFLSNGPGDPEPLEYAISTIRGLLGKKPIFGICLGHQLLGLACGAKTFKLKFGHRGANHPVQNLDTGAVEITSQNHGFAVAEDSLPNFLEVTHRSLNDGTIEGLIAPRGAGLQRAVPSRSLGRPARQPLPVPPVPGIDPSGIRPCVGPFTAQPRARQSRIKHRASSLTTPLRPAAR